MQLSRRRFIGGLLTVISAPALVCVESLMALPAPTKIIRPTISWDLASGLDVTRLDVSYGSVRIRPEWTAIVPEFPISLDEYSERILAPMVNRLAQNVADAVMNGQSVARYDLAGIRSVPLSELLIEARGTTNSHE